jgi:hypothetical protein
MTDDTALDILGWDETGYKPLVLDAAWQVALLNREPLFDLEAEAVLGLRKCARYILDVHQPVKPLGQHTLGRERDIGPG